MWKGPTLLMDTQYPFTPADKKCLVKKRMSKTQKQVQRARLLAALKHDCLIKLESAIEEKGEYYLLFEHVQMPLEKWYLTVTREFIEQYERQLIMFSRYLSDKGILIHFNRENMGVSEAGYPKYFLDPGFEVDGQIDKLSLKKKYKEEIKKEMQFFFDKKVVSTKQVSRVNIPQKKQNAKILKILQALEKGKANLCSQPSKDAPHSSQALMVSSQGGQLDGKSTLKPIKNIQNVIIQKQINKVNKIQLMVNNKAVETIHQEFKREYASSSFYINGLPTLVMEREGETKRLLSPGDKFARFEEVKYKEYKSMKTSGEGYVQDFISVLEADDAQKMTSPGSPRATMRGPPKIAITNSPRTTMHVSPKIKQLPSPLARQALEPDPKSPKSPANKQILPRPPQLKIEEKIIVKNQDIKRAVSPRNDRNRSNLYLSDKAVKALPMCDPVQVKTSCEFKVANRTNELQKKVSQAIANSLNAISKFKNAKGQP